jgi:protein SCO1/2
MVGVLAAAASHVPGIAADPVTRPLQIGRRAFVGLLAALGGCHPKAQWNNVDVTGTFPPLDLTMTRATDGRIVTGETYRGSVVLLYFGYTYCPDICPLTLGNLARVLDRLGKQANAVRVLFVTVDPNRDDLKTLKAYTAQFAPQIVGLRGTPDQLAALARTYRVAYSVEPATAGQPYEVTHSSAIYAFDASGAVRLLIPSMASSKPNIDGTAVDLRQLIEVPDQTGWWARLSRMV